MALRVSARASGGAATEATASTSSSPGVRRARVPQAQGAPSSNAQVAAALGEIADLLEIEGANRFRIGAYRNAARRVASLGRSVAGLDEAALDALPGIGPDLAGKIAELARQGSCALLERLRGEVPEGVSSLLGLRGLGPRRARLLHQELGVSSLAQLKHAASEGRVRGVHGFGARSEQQILDAIAQLEGQVPSRILRSVAEPVAADLLAWLAHVEGVEQAVAAGSLRRACETVGDLDLLVSVRPGSAAPGALARHPEVERVLASGATKCSVVLRGGLQVDLRAVAPESFGAAWLYFTGSKAHNIALRRMAQQSGRKINEYGVFEGARRIAGRTEASVYACLGLPWIEPELREDRGEIEAARAGRLPQLLRAADLRGDLHVHTRASDGQDDFAAMAQAAQALGLEYLAVTDHSRRLSVAHGLDPDRLERQADAIERYNAAHPGFRVLKSCEVDILEDGSLDLPDSVLRRLDLVVGAVHHRFELPRARQTERLLRALDNRYLTILAHPSARLLGRRGPIDFDLLRVLRKARARGCFVELNGDPQRLDLDDRQCRMAREEGVLVSIASDAHGAGALRQMHGAVGQARRGWLGREDVLNARPLAQLLPLLAQARRGGPQGGDMS